MKPDRWHLVESIFGEVATLPEGERAERLAELCGGDEALQREVASLLAADAGAGEFLEESPFSADLTLPPSPAAGWRLGPYLIERQLGAGGMGNVYLARRADGEFHQQVAIKVFSYGAERSDLLRRFRAERQILASLDHPNIARLLDGGTAPGGLPYLVMEYVDGRPIDRYCDERRLGIGERIDLFRQVSAAVQYAHQNLVVHRDIKPSNILVTADGQPLRISRRTYGEEHPWVASQLGNLANVLEAQGDLAAAEPLLVRALAIREKTLGDPHPDIGPSLVALGRLRLARGDPAAAEPCCGGA